MAGPDTLTFTDANFEQEVLRAPGAVLVDFWAPWCGPCRVVGPRVDAVATSWRGRARVGKVNVDEASRTASAYGVSSIPTLMLFVRGQPVDGLIGAVSLFDLEGLLKRNVA